MSDNTEALASTVMRARDEDLARTFVLVFGLAAERHPELLRTALRHVLDMPVIEETLKKIMADLEQTRQKGVQISAGINRLHERLNKAAELMKQVELKVAVHSANGQANGQPVPK